ncbi:HAMP domain-containing protein [Candidatus Poribacteria bacterium]|nr:HAMP domain-containing protein [Candidatus Poribacteria bacterium]
MRLQWKYTLIINSFILLTMTIFFLINDRMVKQESVLSVIRDYLKGATMRDIASRIQERISGENDPERLAKIIRTLDLTEKLREADLEIVDINVTDSNGIVIASLTEKNLDNKIDEEGLQRIYSKQMRLRYPPKGYYGRWVVEYTLPYIRFSQYEYEELGALQIMFSARGIASYTRQLRMRNLLSITLIAVTLTIFIIPLTSYLIVRRLERLMETISTVQSGDLGARSEESSNDEIGRLSKSFNRMIDQINSEHASRLEALGNLAAGVAHEVRNPLNSIAMTIQYLKDTIEDQPESEAQECLDVITRQVEELDRIVEDFLQLTRPIEMNWQTVDLKGFLSDIMRNFVSSMEIANIKLTCNYSSDIIYVRIDPDKIRQAVSNIVINSIQAMPEGGKLTVTTEKNDVQKNAVIKITDTGPGIPEENKDRLFEPYFTTKPDGTGLGLAITYRMIDAHEGEIGVESQINRGTTFTIILPYS